MYDKYAAIYENYLPQRFRTDQAAFALFIELLNHTVLITSVAHAEMSAIKKDFKSTQLY